MPKVTEEDWEKVLDCIEEKIGVDARRLIEHKIQVLERMLLKYQLEQEEDIEDYLGG